jgi:hypothetical protein
VSRRWFLRRSYWQGRSSGRFEREHFPALFRKQLRSQARNALRLALRNGEDIGSLFELTYSVGYLREAFFR